VVRRGITVISIIIISSLAAAALGLVFMFHGNIPNNSNSNRIPIRNGGAPFLDHLTIQSDINLASSYINSLYKDNYPNEVDKPNEARISEYPSVPLLIKLPDGTVTRAGDDVKIFGILSSISSILFPITSISDPHNTKYDTNYDIIFRAKGPFFLSVDRILVLHVIINHNYWTGSTYGTKMTVIQKSFEGSKLSIPYVNVYLGSINIGKVDARRNGHILGNYVYTGNNDLNLRSIRYTERHSTELGYEWYLSTDDLLKANKISNQLIHEGYQLHNDIYSPLFGTDTKLSDNYLFQAGSDGVYRDCYLQPEVRQDSYQYHSKVCTFGVEFYIWYSKNYDSLLPMLWAIHMLNKHHSPDTKYSNGDSWQSPRQVARLVEEKWTGNGIQSPYDSEVASGIRTSVFTILESILGYRHGDTTSRSYADASIQVEHMVQVKSDGIISLYDAGSGTTKQYERSNAIGGFYTSWKHPFIYVATISKLKQIFEWLFNHPDENGDIKPSNAETTFTSAQALRIYDCYKYGYNCMNTPQ
jgi:hypothetical protein